MLLEVTLGLYPFTTGEGLEKFDLSSQKRYAVQDAKTFGQNSEAVYFS